VFFLFLYSRNHKENSDNFDNKELYSKEQENIRLKKEIAENSKKQTIFEYKIDSLVRLKNKVIITYQKKEDEIKNAHSFYVVNELDSIFSRNNIR
jgi:hypothetical protein